MNKFLSAAIICITLPAVGFSQKEKEKVKEKTDVQQIIITRTGDKDEKTIVEIQGDKVKINGKETTNADDVKVRLNNTNRSTTVLSPTRSQGGQGYSMTLADDHPGMFKEDANRAMLGVVTEGREKGAEIVSVTKETAAEKAGLKKGDVLTQIGNKKIESTDDVTEAVRAHKPGDKLGITFLRDGKEQKVTAELGKWKGIHWNTVATPKIENFNELRESFRINPDLDTRIYTPSVVFGRPRLGASVQDTDDGKGVKVLEVDDESHAAKAGLKEGDIITQVDDKAVNGAEELSKSIRQKNDGSTTKLQVLRNGKAQTLEVKFPKKLKTVDL